MPKIVVKKGKCKGCLLCISVCPAGMIVTGDRLNVLGATPVKFNDEGKCVGCSLCAIICPDCCIEVYK